MGDDQIYHTAAPGAPGSLHGTHTSVTIPVGVLAAGKVYQGRLLFAKIVNLNTTSYGQGVSALGAYFRETSLTIIASGNVDMESPYLSNTSPSADDGPVARHSGVAFQFSQRMQPVQAINWTGLDPAKVSYHWTDDGQVLYCLYSQQLPPGATITWQIHREGFRDIAGNMLSMDSDGRFTTATASALGLPDFSFAGLVKSEIFEPSKPHIRGSRISP